MTGDKDPNEITYDYGKIDGHVIWFGENKISIKQLAMVAENMRQTLLELGYVIALNEQQINSNTTNGDANV